MRSGADGVDTTADNAPAARISAEPAIARGYRSVQAAKCWGVRRAYVSRQPERTVLHRVVREHLETFLAEARDILHAIATTRRVAVKACHASGKTFVAAAAVLWWVTRFRDGIVVTTAPTWTQVERVLWGEIKKAVGRSRIGYPALNQTELKLGPNNYAIGLSTNEGVRFQGFHGRILIVLDEAPGVKPEILGSDRGHPRRRGCARARARQSDDRERALL